MPEVQLEIEESQAQLFHEAKRIQQSLITNLEKRVLLWLAKRTPEKVNSDHLTVLGAAGMFLAGASYGLSRYSHYGLLLSCVFLAINWLGDSLDGTLARFRSRQRPRYGFYVDHVIDCFGVTALLGGLGASGYMHPLVAVWLLVAYLLLSSEIFLATYALGRFEMSYFHLGPTELRILLCLGNLYLFFQTSIPSFHSFGFALSVVDLCGVIGGLGMVAIAIVSFVRHARLLYDAERLE
ncbi:MAG: CDP-alcohol phosphatidyltransferase family protein [Terriglobales bacterium]|jgi:archaetidylinositol phosphate synthase